MKSRKIVVNDDVYSEIEYDLERETVENFAVEKKFELFGNKIIYEEDKKIIKSKAGTSKIPDGMFLDLESYDNAKLVLVEYELSEHDLIGHVTPQIIGFVNAFNNEDTRKKFRELFYKKIQDDKANKMKIKNILPPGQEIHHFLENILDKEIGILIVIDNITDELEDLASNVKIRTGIDTQNLQFNTFENDKGEKIHLFDEYSRDDVSRRKGIMKGNRTWDDYAEIFPSKEFEVIKSFVEKLLQYSKEHNWPILETLVFNKDYVTFKDANRSQRSVFDVGYDMTDKKIFLDVRFKNEGEVLPQPWVPYHGYWYMYFENETPPEISEIVDVLKKGLYP